MDDLTKMLNDHLEWSMKNFPEATAKSCLSKLCCEIEEVADALDLDPNNKSALSEEYADCLMCIVTSAGKAGVSVERLLFATQQKLEKNKNRQWVKNPDNTYSHISPSKSPA